jgi:hypothetical protein
VRHTDIFNNKVTVDAFPAAVVVFLGLKEPQSLFSSSLFLLVHDINVCDVSISFSWAERREKRDAIDPAEMGSDLRKQQSMSDSTAQDERTHTYSRREKANFTSEFDPKERGEGSLFFVLSLIPCLFASRVRDFRYFGETAKAIFPFPSSFCSFSSHFVS